MIKMIKNHLNPISAVAQRGCLSGAQFARPRQISRILRRPPRHLCTHRQRLDRRGGGKVLLSIKNNPKTANDPGAPQGALSRF